MIFSSKILRQIVVVLLFMSVAVMFNVSNSVETASADNQKIESLRVSSTIAGFDTNYSVYGVSDDFVLLLKGPTGRKNRIDATSMSGVVPGKFLKESGRYDLTLFSRSNNGNLFGAVKLIPKFSKSFHVLPSGVSKTRSSIKFLVTPTVGTSVPVVLTLNDDYGNPVANHRVEIFHSNNGAVSFPNGDKTNDDGKLMFKYKKLAKGDVELLALDVVDNVTISNVDIAKFAQASVYGFGGDLLAQAEDDRFEFTGTPSSVEPLEDFSFTLRALDEAGELDSNYTGTVSFSSETDLNVSLPADFTFELADSGQHTFTSAAYFIEEGAQTIDVVDVDDDTLIGSVDITVEASDGAGDGEGGVLEVLSPSAGVSTSSVITFSGVADPGLEVNVLDNGELLDSVDADEEGNFTYESPVLPNGEYVFVLQTSTAESDEIPVTIDTTSTLVSSIELDPETVAAGDPVSVRVDLKSEVDRVSVVVSDVVSELVQADTIGRSFAGQFTAPLSDEEYGVSVVIVDSLGETTTIDDVATLSVTADGLGVPDSGITFNVPSQVLGLQATPADKQVNLSWQPATDNTGIDYYRILYGTSATQLNNIVDTNDSSTNWFIPKLTNGLTYYFQVYGVDTEGNLGDQGSAIVSAAPGAGQTTTHGTGDGQVLVGVTADTGPGMLGLLGASLFGGWAVRKFNSQ